MTSPEVQPQDLIKVICHFLILDNVCVLLYIVLLWLRIYLTLHQFTFADPGVSEIFSTMPVTFVWLSKNWYSTKNSKLHRLFDSKLLYFLPEIKKEAVFNVSLNVILSWYFIPKMIDNGWKMKIYFLNCSVPYTVEKRWSHH